MAGKKLEDCAEGTETVSQQLPVLEEALGNSKYLVGLCVCVCSSDFPFSSFPLGSFFFQENNPPLLISLLFQKLTSSLLLVISFFFLFFLFFLPSFLVLLYHDSHHFLELHDVSGFKNINRWLADLKENVKGYEDNYGAIVEAGKK